MQSSVLLSCIVSAAFSWTYVPVSDFNLVKTSEVIVYGTVTEELSEAPYQTDRVYRYYRINVEDKILGSIGNNQTLIVRALGGYDASSGTFYGYPGSPVLSTNEKVLLFLKRTPEHANVFDFLHFGLGSFHELSNGEYAYRVSDLTEDKNSNQIRKMRDFINWMKLIATSVAGPIPTYWANFPTNLPTFGSARREIHARYNTMKSGSTNVKWQTFTQGGTVNWYVNPNNAPALSGGGLNEIQQAFSAWNFATPEVTNVIKYNYVGSSTKSGGLATSDSENTVLYEDPNNEIAGSFNCQTGGTLAIGGWRARSPAFTWRSTSWYSIVEADMVVQDGISCWISSNPRASQDWANMLTHEFGHTLAMGHSCGDSATGSCVSGSPADLATMRAYLRSGVGAVLGADDKEGINFLYASCWPNCNTPSTTGQASPVTGQASPVTTGRVVATTGGINTTGRSTTGKSRVTTGRCRGLFC